MKAIYVKPSLKLKGIDAHENMLAGSGENNFIFQGGSDNATGSLSGTDQVDGASALSKKNAFFDNIWTEEE